MRKTDPLDIRLAVSQQNRRTQPRAVKIEDDELEGGVIQARHVVVRQKLPTHLMDTRHYP
jgi:hypothetical protein